MNSLKRFSATLLATVLISGIGLSTAVSARTTQTDSTSLNSGTHTEKVVAVTETTDSSTSTGGSENTTKTTNLRAQLEALAQHDVANKKAQVKQQSEAERQKVCEAHTNGLSKRMSTAVKVAQTHKANFDRIYAKVKTFHDSKNLTVSNYDSLIATADASGSVAATSISALQSLNISIDCTSATVANNVGAFQQAVKATRDSLKTYRSDIIAVITALKGASSTNEGGQ